MTAMPSPARTVTRSVAVLRRAGMGERAALETVAAVCGTVRCKLMASHIQNITWICQVETDARVRLARLAERQASP